MLTPPLVCAAFQLATAQQASVKEFITMMASVGSKVATTNGLNATIAEFLQGVGMVHDHQPNVSELQPWLTPSSVECAGKG